MCRWKYTMSCTSSGEGPVRTGVGFGAGRYAVRRSRGSGLTCAAGGERQSARPKPYGRRSRMASKAATARSPASRRLPRYCWVVVICRSPRRSMTTLRSAPPGEQPRRSWKRTRWRTPDRSIPGSQTPGAERVARDRRTGQLGASPLEFRAMAVGVTQGNLDPHDSCLNRQDKYRDEGHTLLSHLQPARCATKCTHGDLVAWAKRGLSSGNLGSLGVASGQIDLSSPEQSAF